MRVQPQVLAGGQQKHSKIVPVFSQDVDDDDNFLTSLEPISSKVHTHAKFNRENISHSNDHASSKKDDDFLDGLSPISNNQRGISYSKDPFARETIVDQGTISLQ